MPIRIAVWALLRKSRLQGLAAIGAESCCAHRVRPARMLDPDPGPGNGAKCKGANLMHRHHLPPLTYHSTKPCLVLVRQIRKLGDNGTALGALRPTRRLRVNHQTEQLVLCVGSRVRPHALHRTRCVRWARHLTQEITESADRRRLHAVVRPTCHRTLLRTIWLSGLSCDTIHLPRQTGAASGSGTFSSSSKINSDSLGNGKDSPSPVACRRASRTCAPRTPSGGFSRQIDS